MERIVAICSTVVTRLTDCIISIATRDGLLLHDISALSFSIDHCSAVPTTVVELQTVVTRYMMVDVFVLRELSGSSVSKNFIIKRGLA